MTTYLRGIAFHAEPALRDPAHGNDDAELLAFPSGDTVRILVDSRATDGAFTVLDCTHVAGPTERHVHGDADKSVFVLAGRYRFSVGDDVIAAGPGDNVLIRRGVAHDFAVGIDGGRALFVFSPGGVEEYFRRLADLADGSGSPAAVDALRRRHHIAPVGPAPGVDT